MERWSRTCLLMAVIATGGPGCAPDVFEPCGGDPTGRWVVESFEVAAPRSEGACAGTSTGGTVIVNDAWVALEPGGRYYALTDSMVHTVSSYPSSCGLRCDLLEEGYDAAGYTAACAASDGGCTCELDQHVAASAFGTWVVDEMERLVVTDGRFSSGTSHYCVREDEMTLVDSSGLEMRAHRAAPGQVPDVPEDAHCLVDPDCPGLRSDWHCDLTAYRCVACAVDAHCGEGQLCVDGTCGSCRTDDDCEGDRPLCVAIVNPFTGPSHTCGDCRSDADCDATQSCTATGQCW